MVQRDRRQVRYEDFVKRDRKRSSGRIALMTGAFALAIVAAGGVAWWSGVGQTPALRPPPALSNAGAPVGDERYQWKPVAVGGGGMISGLSFDPAGKTFVVRTDVHGGYIWDAAANRWSQLVSAAAMPAIDRVQNGGAEGVYEIAVAPSRPQRIYMAIKGRVYRTDDRGENWSLASAGNPFPFTWNANSEFRLHGPFLAVHPSNPDLLFLGTPGNGMWRSTNAGVSWSRVASVPVSVDRAPGSPGAHAPGTMIWFERPAGGKPTGRIFAMSSGNGMYVSTDQGVSFSPLGAGMAAPKTLQRGAFDRNGTFFGVDDASKSVWSFRDGKWTDLTTMAGLKAREYAAVAANPRADQILIFDRGGAGYESTDGGKSWSNVSHSADVGEGDPPWLRVADQPFFTTADIMFDPVRPNRLWVAGGVGVFYADFEPGSGHASWISQTRGIEELVSNDIIQAPGQPPVFSGWDFGLHVKADLNAYSTTFGPNERSLMSVQQVDWTPAKPGFLVTNASDTRMSCCWEDGNSVMAGYSTDGGRKWSKFGSLPTPPGTKASDHWRMSFGSIAVSANDPDNIVWAPAFNRQPYFTKDRGTTWQPVQLAGATGDNPGSFKDIWLNRKTLTADKTAPGTFYLVHSGDAPNMALAGLWRTSDGGETWQRVFDGEIAPASHMAAKLRSVPGHAGHLFFTAGFEHTGDTQLRRSTDGGAHWQVVAGVTRVDDVAFGKAAKGASYPTIFISGRVGGEYGIWRSIDNAGSWQRLAEFPVGRLDQVTVLGADPDVFGRVYVGYMGSGWVWGEPAPCKPAPLVARAPSQCVQVR